MATHPTEGLTYQDLERMFPEDDHIRRELLDGKLFVTPSPGYRHQRAVGQIFLRLHGYAEESGGEVLVSPFDVKLSDTNVLIPDVLFLTAGNEPPGPRYLPAAPDLAVEVSSPSTRRTDLSRKKEIYERFGVREYWFVDLDEDAILVFVLEGGAFGEPLAFGGGETLRSSVLEGFEAAVDDLIGQPTR